MSRNTHVSFTDKLQTHPSLSICVRVCALHHSAKLSQGDFGHWLQLMHCTYLLVWSEYFRQKISMEINPRNRVLCPVTPLGMLTNPTHPWVLLSFSIISMPPAHLTMNLMKPKVTSIVITPSNILQPLTPCLQTVRVQARLHLIGPR